MKIDRGIGQYSQERESGLEPKVLTAGETISYLVGTNIGAGVLSLAYAARKTGYIPLVTSLITTSAICTVIMLYVAESCLRTYGNRQLSGMAHRYLGSAGAWITFLGVAGSSYGALIAYMAGSGEILVEFFGRYGLSREVGGLLFVIPSMVVMYMGLKALGIGQKLFSISMAVMVGVLILATLMHQQTDLDNLLPAKWEYMVPIFNLAVFIFGAQFLVPEIVRGNLHNPQRLPQLIIISMVIILLIVIVIPTAVIALVGLENISQVATISWGEYLGSWAYYGSNGFASFAMLTSYWGMGMALFSNIFDHFQLGSEMNFIKRISVLAVIAIPPFILAFSGLTNFVDALYFAGTFGEVIIGIVPIAILYHARRSGDREPEFICGWYAHVSIQAMIVTLFLLSGVYALASSFGFLPASW